MSEAIKEVKRYMPLQLSVLADKTPCFGILWIDEYGTECPETGCDLRLYCEQAFNLKSVISSQNTFVLSNPLVNRNRKLLKKDITNRGKWLGTEKFKRKGYVHQNRKVDFLLDYFKEELPKYKVYNRLSLQVTASYHLIKYNNVPIARLWTNSKKAMIVDISPELIAPINTMLGYYSEREITKSYPIPQTKKGFTTFRDRVKIRSNTGITVLIKALDDLYARTAILR